MTIATPTSYTFSERISNVAGYVATRHPAYRATFEQFRQAYDLTTNPEYAAELMSRLIDAVILRQSASVPASTPLSDSVKYERAYHAIQEALR